MENAPLYWKPEPIQGIRDNDGPKSQKPVGVPNGISFDPTLNEPGQRYDPNLVDRIRKARDLETALTMSGGRYSLAHLETGEKDTLRLKFTIVTGEFRGTYNIGINGNAGIRVRYTDPEIEKIIAGILINYTKLNREGMKELSKIFDNNPNLIEVYNSSVTAHLAGQRGKSLQRMLDEQKIH